MKPAPVRSLAADGFARWRLELFSCLRILYIEDRREMDGCFLSWSVKATECFKKSAMPDRQWQLRIRMDPTERRKSGRLHRRTASRYRYAFNLSALADVIAYAIAFNTLGP